MKPVCSNSNLAEYDDMVEHLKKYLTKAYDVGDGPLFVKSPIDYCKINHANKVERAILQTIDSLAKNIEGSSSSSIESVVSKERVALAKDRLKQMRNNMK